jgi:hypothetical protein
MYPIGPILCIKEMLPMFSSGIVYTHEIDPFVSFDIPGVYAFFPDESKLLMRYLDDMDLHPVPLYATDTDEYTLGQFYQYLRNHYVVS